MPARPGRRSAARVPNSASPPSLIVDGAIVNGFALTGVSSPPDPTTNAYRKDLADTALASQVVASHYAEPLLRNVATTARAFAAPSSDSAEIAVVEAGAQIRILDCSRGWAWGYLDDGRVAYVSATALQL